MKIFNIIRSVKSIFNADDKTLNCNYNITQYSPREEMQNIKVSIIVPVYNAHDYIRRCLHYLISQSLEEIEIIVINDGSTDDSLSIIKEYANIDKRIKIINQENKLQGYARNRGIEIAKGEYIGFCDADDYVDYSYYEELYLAAKKYDSDISMAENIRVSSSRFKRRLNITDEKIVEGVINKFKSCNQHKNECPTNKIYRKSFLINQNIDFTEGVYCEDKLFSLKAVYYANKIVTVPGVHYYYWENPVSTVNAHKTKKHIKDRILAKQAVLNFVKEKKIPVKNWYFKAEKNRISLFGIPIFLIQESTQSEKGCLFGFLPLYKIKYRSNII